MVVDLSSRCPRGYREGENQVLRTDQRKPLYEFLTFTLGKSQPMIFGASPLVGLPSTSVELQPLSRIHALPAAHGQHLMNTVTSISLLPHDKCTSVSSTAVIQAYEDT